MNDSINEEEFQFEFDICEHIDQKFHNEQVVEENEYSFYMCYENEDVDSILPSELIYIASLIGETDRNNIYSLPHESLDENQTYDRVKEFC